MFLLPLPRRAVLGLKGRLNGTGGFTPTLCFLPLPRPALLVFTGCGGKTRNLTPTLAPARLTFPVFIGLGGKTGDVTCAGFKGLTPFTFPIGSYEHTTMAPF